MVRYSKQNNFHRRAVLDIPFEQYPSERQLVLLYKGHSTVFGFELSAKGRYKN